MFFPKRVLATRLLSYGDVDAGKEYGSEATNLIVQNAKIIQKASIQLGPKLSDLDAVIIAALKLSQHPQTATTLVERCNVGFDPLEVMDRICKGAKQLAEEEGRTGILAQHQG